MAISTVAANAQIRPANSFPFGKCRPITHVNSMTNTVLSICSTVAVPALVNAMVMAYANWSTNSAPPNTRKNSFTRGSLFHISSSI